MADLLTLCPRCNDIDFTKVVSSTGKVGLRPELLLGPPESWHVSSCALCRFFSTSLPAAIRSMKRKPACYLWSTKAEFYENEGGILPDPAERIMFIAPLDFKSKLAGISLLDMLIFTPLPKHNLQSGRIGTVNTTIDFELVKTWLSKCHSDQQHYCERTRCEIKRAHNLILINCTTYELETPKLVNEVEFAALSYVWGTSSQPSTETLEEPVVSSLRLNPTHLPQVVLDAITVCREIEIPYIWVDRYCIPQDSEIKHEQIANMHRIYATANLTIVAAAGQHASYGLPGVSLNRNASKYLRLQDSVIIHASVNPQARVIESPWFSRGWTYQEGELSVRRLYFTEHQLLFECEKSLFQESYTVNKYVMDGLVDVMPITMADQLYKVYVGSTTSHLTNDRLLWKGHDNINTWKMITAYSQRNLTYPTDILKGMLGFFQVMAALPSGPGYHIWGIPFNADWEPSYQDKGLRMFISSLGWDLIRPSRRRIKFPSWSWTGWYGGLGPHRNYNSIRPSPPTFEKPYINREIRVQIERKDGTLLPWNELLTALPTADSRIFSEYIHLKVPAVKLPFSFILSTVSESSNTYFLITERIKNDGKGESGENRTKNYHIPLKLTRIVDVGDNIHQALLQGRCHCLVLHAPGIAWSMVLVVLVNPESGISERIGIIEGWSEPEPQWWNQIRKARMSGQCLQIERERTVTWPGLAWETFRLG